MNKSKVYQNDDINQYVGVSKRNCCPTSTTPNKLYTIYEEFDIKYYYKMMKEGIYQEIEEGILECWAEDVCDAGYYKHSEEK